MAAPITCAILFSNPSPFWLDSGMFPGSAHTVRAFRSPPMAAPPAANRPAAKATRGNSPVFCLFNRISSGRSAPRPRKDLDLVVQRRLHDGCTGPKSNPPHANKCPVTFVTGHPNQCKFSTISELIAQPERVQGAAPRNVAEVGCLGHGGRTDGAELIVEIQSRRHRQSDPAAYTRPYRHILLA